jgi:amino acid adenylation domain-containing protein
MAFSVSDVASPCCRGPDLPFPADRCVHEIIETQVDRAPQARAVVEGNRQLTYRELSRRADALAVHLRTLGVGPESLVGLYLERSLEAIVGILGVLKAGGGYVPLDPAYPQERIDFMVHDADPQVILTAGRLRHRLDAYDKPVVCLDGDEYSMDGNGAHPLGQRGNPGNGAYVIYTSGSTGKPKGVMVSHRNLVHSTWARMQYYQESVVAFLLLSSLSFDSSVAGIFWTLAQGGALVVAPTSLQHDPPGIVRALEEQGISHTLCVPALYGLVLESLQSQELPTLRSVIVAGEACPPGIVERHRELLPNVGLFNEYGPTEATVWSTVFDCHDVLQARSVPIGRPIPRAAIYLLDGEGRSVSAGSPGELCIGGPGVTRGYLRRPDLTDERFIPDRHGGGETRRIYRTGDLARLLPDGNIEFLGRLDDQVKIRGFRVELGEIESAVRMHADVREVAVIAREDPRGAKQVVAYVVPASPGDELTGELRSLVRAALPEHMVPAAFVLLDTLPRLPNGKMDRGALPAPELDRSNRAGEYAAPRTPVEQALAQIWSQVLSIADVGIHDDFFALGGDSLLSMQIVARASQVGMRVTAEQIADRPTIAGLAEVVGPATVPTHAEQGVVSGPVPLVPLQRYVLEQMMRTGRRRRAWASQSSCITTRCECAFPLTPLERTDSTRYARITRFSRTTTSAD